MSGKHEVVITGIGLVTPIGNNREQNWTSLKNGCSGLSFFKDFPKVGSIAPVVGSVKEEQSLIDSVLSKKDQHKTERFIQLAVVAANEAMNDAQLSRTEPCERERFGSYLGTGIGGVATICKASNLFSTGGGKKISPFTIPKAISNEAASWLSMIWNIQGPILALANACSSSADAVGLAYRAIRDGYADYMLAGGTESCLNPICLAAFGNMRALSSWPGDAAGASRPFDKYRSGFVMAEGAGVLVLERKDLAEKRRAKCYAQIKGYAATADAHHITAMHPEGRGAISALRGALQQAGLKPEQVGYINAHGTGTQMNDLIETAVIKEVFGSHAKNVVVSSTKSMTGHLLGAAGGVEIAYTALALQNRLIPPTINRDTVDEQCDLDYATYGTRPLVGDYALSSSFGFGGGNAVMVLKRIE